MPLKDKAKTEYMREYMRRRRAGQATTKPRTKAAETAAIDPAELQKLEAQLARQRTEIRNLKAKVRWYVVAGKGIPMTKRLDRHIRACLHPDRAPRDAATQRRWTEYAQEYTALKITLVD